MQVPVVSLAASEEKAAAVLHQACLEHGFFYRETLAVVLSKTAGAIRTIPALKCP
jgi:hypothetical protein